MPSPRFSPTEIYAINAAFGQPGKEVAARFGCNVNTIYRIWNGEVYSPRKKKQPFKLADDLDPFVVQLAHHMQRVPFTVEQASADSGVSVTAISSWFRLGISPSLSNFRKVAEAVGLKMSMEDA